MKKTLLIANWKANPVSVKEAIKLFSLIKKIKKTNQDVVVCLPGTYIGFVKGGAVKIGAQNVSEKNSGPYTGEVAASMLKSVGASYCIVGHSERRKMGEDNNMISEKIKNLLKVNIIPILCIGEKERGHNGEHFKEITDMLLSSIVSIPKKNLEKIVLAYEPLWAISTENKGAMDADAVHETVIFLKKVLNDALGKNISSKIKIIYGGSVDSKNAKEIIEKSGADGFLVGRASLSFKSFKAISDSIL